MTAGQVYPCETRGASDYFTDEIAAAKAYDEATKKYYEEFAVLNLPSE